LTYINLYVQKSLYLCTRNERNDINKMVDVSERNMLCRNIIK